MRTSEVRRRKNKKVVVLGGTYHKVGDPSLHTYIYELKSYLDYRTRILFVL